MATPVQISIIPLSDGWGVFVTNAPLGNGPLATVPKKDDACRVAAALAVGLALCARRLSSRVVVHDRSGRIRAERTYPRASTPRPS